ncbi:MAG: triphosphoribosyl-dephospho-CoA synthase [Methylotenera sp.]|nr:triphosphoribosyl-dephospho-CoA synthase [Methylotenera sp.]MDO9233570.1 triphosphoribosyl-dephospho-CoA synthase [Methylotenera sp.]MDO9388806.1 triphosphoribosyl-dephospho-CoA synthase [Methylotenera sp.]MDP2103143.1 triphosphoribosyl-dephospho-CoA synthase [Methylotenera sp.]MDP2281967.1 triphosphoribosyl-dephospho-CoA synthase [Methylotenera sp.]
MLKKYTPEQLAKAYKTACMAELQALKPGNVHVFADGHGMTIHDFIKSADVSAEVIAQPDLTVGERVLYAVEVTQQAVGQNTNLGVLLLCAPLIHAALNINNEQTLQQSLVYTLNQLTVDDAKLVAKAILLASPAGLGGSALHDVHDVPNVTLVEMMHWAQDKDRIAWQYANTYHDVAVFGITRYAEAMVKWQNPAWAVAALYLGLLTRHPDTHIQRKYGEALAVKVMQEAHEVEADYWATDNPKLVQKRLLAWDASLKLRGFNPGTSADLTVATLLLTSLT